jgi:hypothetical protein
VDYAAWTVLLPELWILRIVVAFGLFLCVQVIEIAKELVEAVVGRQMFVAVTKMILAELTAGVAEGLQ